MIEEVERSFLIDLLAEVLARTNAPREALCEAIADLAFAIELPTTTHPAMLFKQAVDLCIRDARSHEPPWLVRLVDSPLFGIHVGTPRLLAIKAQVATWTAPPDLRLARQSTLLDGRTPFVDRQLLRGHLARLETAASRQQPILVVNGQARAGKSYTRRYVDHFVFTRMALPRIVAHPYEFKPDQALALGPLQLAQELVSSLGGDATRPPPPETNLKLYVSQLAAWVLNEAVHTGHANWFVLDGFELDPAEPESRRPRADTMDFLIALSDKITGGSYVEQCRLVLTGFDRALLTVDPGQVEEERVRPCTRPDAVACLKELLQRAPVAVPLERLEPLIVDGLPPVPARMPELNARLRTLLRAMAALAEILPGAAAAEFTDWLVEMLRDLPADAARMTELERRLDALQAAVIEGPGT
jgi:hypothetical protein